MNISSYSLLTFVLRVTCRCVNDINTLNKLQYLYYTAKCICPIEQHVSTSYTNFENIRKTRRSKRFANNKIFWAI
jgi:hypothetical protein